MHMSEESGSSIVAKLIDKLPDVHFDWYARFLPGTFIILVYRYTKGAPYTLEPSGSKLLLLIGIAYLIGHVLQPFASRCAVVFRKDAIEKIYTAAKKDKDLKSMAAKVTKAHAESVSMFSIFLGVILIWLKWGLLSESWRCGLLVIAVGFFVAGFERVDARERKIKELKPQSVD